MSVTCTNKQKIYKLERIAKDKDISHKNQMKGLKKHRIAEGIFQTTICTQCERGMSRYLGKLQKENKRENAPICIPCIEGRARKLLINQ